LIDALELEEVKTKIKKEDLEKEIGEIFLKKFFLKNFNQLQISLFLNLKNMFKKIKNPNNKNKPIKKMKSKKLVRKIRLSL